MANAINDVMLRINDVVLRANIREAFYGHGTADFIAKLQIALKESSESEYWLELLIESGYYDNKDILDKCIEVKKLLVTSINTAKSKLNK